MSRALLLVSLAAVTLAAVGCTASRAGSGSSPPSTSVASASPTPVLPSATLSSATPSLSKSSSASVVPTTSASSARPTATAKPTPAGPASCSARQLTVSAVRGGAYQGREIAGILFTNASSSRCTVRGYPSVQLWHKGKPLGQPATHDRGSVRTLRLGPAQAAQAQLTAVTTCQSAISDHARVRAPGASSSVDVSIQLRGCAISVGPLEPA